ncbi:MAG: hypothetical protein N3G20_03760 [Verrucomicrobiae bacterium]|nr:hypothetical protein [Verrucomicrobiae bacterium]
MAREAFRATLEIENQTPGPLEQVGVDLEITDTARESAVVLFDIPPPELEQISDVSGIGVVQPGTRARARWTIVPTVYAAPTEPVRYYVSGVFRYTVDGVDFVVPLVPVPITVNPTARLALHYFHQRDVFSDDPFTDAVEPSVPFNLAVLVHNRGAGTAKNFRITSAQPEIVDNEKGLLIDFKIIATEVAGREMKPALTADFGDIPPGRIAIARWLMTSTLQGLFIDYSATFEHLDGRGNPRLPIIDRLDIHELIRLVQAGGPFEDGQQDFLVNDRPDLMDLPATLWLSDGSSSVVEVVANAVVQGTVSSGSLVVLLTAFMPQGWVYIKVPDPAAGRYRLLEVKRSDGSRITIGTNAWVTDRTFLGLGKRPRREHVLHLLDYNGTGQYTLRYEPFVLTDTEPPTSMVDPLPLVSRNAFLVTWSGHDNAGGSGVGSYDIYYSENGGPFTRWLSGTTTTSGVFQGTSGKTYAFYSVATDLVGNREPVPAAPEAQTTVGLENRAPVFEPAGDVVLKEGESLNLKLVAVDPDGDALTYRLGAGASAGMTLNGITGWLSWATGEIHGPSTNIIAVIAQDTWIPSMTSTQAVIVVVEVNSAPVLEPITDHQVAEGTC